MKAMLQEGENIHHTDAQCPQKAKKHAIPLLQMQASFTTQKQEFIYGIFLILMYK